MGKWCLHATFSFLIKSPSKLLVTRTGIKAWTSLISGLCFPWPIYMFLEMRFDLGTLDSGERSLPFGLLVYLYEHLGPLSYYFCFFICMNTWIHCFQKLFRHTVDPITQCIQVRIYAYLQCIVTQGKLVWFQWKTETAELNLKNQFLDKRILCLDKILHVKKLFWVKCLMIFQENLRHTSRRLIKESKSCPITLASSGRFSSHSFYLFNDIFIHSHVSPSTLLKCFYHAYFIPVISKGNVGLPTFVCLLLCQWVFVNVHLSIQVYFSQIMWVRSCENVSYAICEQQRHRSACASAQSDQHLYCSLLR